eukprot:gene29643-18282_t
MLLPSLGRSSTRLNRRAAASTPRVPRLQCKRVPCLVSERAAHVVMRASETEVRAAPKNAEFWNALSRRE